MRKKQVVVIGSSDESSFLEEARAIGGYVADHGCVLISGGRGGIMEAASRGAQERGGTVIGILPGDGLDMANPYCSIVIPTGMGYARNVINILSADVVVAIGGKAGTLSELAYAWLYGKPVVCCTFAGGCSADFPGTRIDDRPGSMLLTARNVDEACAHIAELLQLKGY
jgi:uncharacterized protein (TIGR00725 family)